MKNIYLLLVCFIFSSTTFAQTCIIDTSSVGFISPNPDALPCVERGVPYSQTIQISVPEYINLKDFFPTIPIALLMFVDSLEIDSVTGLPSGLAYSLNPDTNKLYGGDNACALLEGTTNATAQRYNIKFHGRITVHGQQFPGFFDGDTTIDLAIVQNNPQNPFRIFLEVVEPGAPCTHIIAAGVNDHSAELNAAISVSPNPANGVFQFNLNAAHRINGEINVLDVTGKQVFNQKLDVTGLYNTTIDLTGFAGGLYVLQLKTAEGIATKNIRLQ